MDKNFSDAVTNLVFEDGELKERLRQKVFEAIDKMDFAEIIAPVFRDAIERDIEYRDETLIDISEISKVITAKILKALF